jgi:hypothetical protein
LRRGHDVTNSYTTGNKNSLRSKAIRPGGSQKAAPRALEDAWAVTGMRRPRTASGIKKTWRKDSGLNACRGDEFDVRIGPYLAIHGQEWRVQNARGGYNDLIRRVPMKCAGEPGGLDANFR